MVTRRPFLAATLAFVVGLAACASDPNAKPTGTTQKGLATTSSTEKKPLTDSFRGVTKDSIKVGIMVIDQDCIKDFVDSSRGPQQAIAEAEIKDINANGGVLGRKIVAVYKKYCPIPGRQPDPLTICTSLAATPA